MPERILITGISGFIAKHIALQLLQAGYDVCGTVRALNKTDQIKHSLSKAGADISRLSFAAADLVKDDGWAEAAEGCSGVMHVASPFPLIQPRDRNALTPAARDGALRVLRASKNADRIVMTSSMAAMMYRPGRPSVMPVQEADWTDTEWNKLSPYVVSKTAAEKAAWDTATAEGFKHRLTTINPGLVLGPAMDDDFGASLDLIKMLMTGAYPAVPPVSYPTVDVRDVATLHVKALQTPEAGGRRLIAAAETLSIKDIASILKDAFPNYSKNIPTRELPSFLVPIAAFFDRSIASILPDLGCTPQAETSYVKAMTGIEFRTGREAVVSAGRSIVDIKAL